MNFTANCSFVLRSRGTRILCASIIFALLIGVPHALAQTGAGKPEGSFLAAQGVSCATTPCKIGRCDVVKQICVDGTGAPVTNSQTPDLTNFIKTVGAGVACDGIATVCGTGYTCSVTTHVCVKSVSGNALDLLQNSPTPTDNAPSNGGSYVPSTGAPESSGAPTADAAAGNDNSSTGFVPLAAIPGLTDTQSSVNAGSLAKFFNNLYKYLIGLAAVLAVIQVIRGGLEYATQDSVSSKDVGKQHIQQALFGLVLVLSPYLIFSIINPSILDLSLNLPTLKLAGGTSGGNGDTTDTGKAVTETTLPDGVTQKVTGTVFQTAVFSSKNDAANNTEAAAWAKVCLGVGKVTQQSKCSSYQGSTCLSASDAEAYCGKFSPLPLVYTDSGWSSWKLTLVPIASDASAASTFAATCTTDAGHVCVPNKNKTFGADGSGLDGIKSTCPSGVDASTCYQQPLLCAPPNDTSICVADLSASVLATTGCTKTVGTEYKTATCSTEQSAADWVTQNCPSPSKGTVSSGSYQGDAAKFSVACPGISSREFTFVELKNSGQYGPADQDYSTVQGFVSACDSDVTCFLADSSSDNMVEHAISSCPTHNLATTGKDPNCYKARLVCSSSNQNTWYAGLNLCIKGAVLIGKY